jgi:DNA polymerase III epsilon subunit-like protein
MSTALIGTPRQVAYAERIKRNIAQRYPDEELPDITSAKVWIGLRGLAPDEIARRAQEELIIGSPFYSVYPRHTRTEAIETLRALPDFYTVLDCETTGLGKGAEITEIALVDPGGEIIFHSLIRPEDGILEKYATSKAAQVSGLTPVMLRQAPMLADACPELCPLLSGLLVSFNAGFDGPMIRQSAQAYGLEMPSLTMLCAMKLSAAFLERDYYPSLSESAEMLGIDRDVYGQAHTATSDAMTAAAILMKMQEDAQFDFAHAA